MTARGLGSSALSRRARIAGAGLGSALAAASVTALLVTVVEHKEEASRPFFRVVAIDGKTHDARAFRRRGQFYIDFTDAENSTGFHAPQESERVLALAIDLCRKGQNALRESATPVKLAAK